MTERKHCHQCELETIHEKFELSRRMIEEFQSIRMEFHSVDGDATFWVACTRCRLHKNRIHLPTLTEADQHDLKLQSPK